LLICLGINSYSQTDSAKTDTIKPKHIKSPHKAMVFSMIVPGLGQAYNRKYWKIPIIYAALGTTVYLFNYNNNSYKEYKHAYIFKTDKDSTTYDPLPELTADEVITYEKTFKKYRDLSAILTFLFYTLNVADAYVDAHLTTFDVSDKLSMRVSPSMNISAFDKKPTGVITLSFRF